MYIIKKITNAMVYLLIYLLDLTKFIALENMSLMFIISSVRYLLLQR